MQEFLMSAYMWIKAIHVIAVISFMAGMLYLPRLFVYHTGAVKGSDLSETLKIMERRLLRFIINPALLVATICGALMIWANPTLLSEHWMHAKLGLFLGLGAIHGLFSKWRKCFERDDNKYSAKFFRIWNEVPTAIMVFIVVLVIVKPF